MLKVRLNLFNGAVSMRFTTFIAVCLLSVSLVLGPVSAAFGQVSAACSCRVSATVGNHHSPLSSRIDKIRHCTQKAGRTCKMVPGLPPIEHSILPSTNTVSWLEGSLVQSLRAAAPAASRSSKVFSLDDEHLAQLLYLHQSRLVI